MTTTHSIFNYGHIVELYSNFVYSPLNSYVYIHWILDFKYKLLLLLYHCILCVALLVYLVVLCVASLTVFVNCLVWLDRPCMVFQRMCMLCL